MTRIRLKRSRMKQVQSKRDLPQRLPSGPQGDLEVAIDMDGTLVESIGGWAVANQKAFLRFSGGVPLDFSLLGLKPGATTYDYAVAKVNLLHRTGLNRKVTVRQMARAIDDEMITFIREHSIRTTPGALEFLEDLRANNVRYTLVTAASKRVVRAYFQEAPELAAYFTRKGSIVTSDSVRRSQTKPHPRPYQFAASSAGVDPRRVIAIEDSETGLISAKAAGLLRVHVNPEIKRPDSALFQSNHRVMRVRSLVGMSTAKLRAFRAAHADYDLGQLAPTSAVALGSQGSVRMHVPGVNPRQTPAGKRPHPVSGLLNVRHDATASRLADVAQATPLVPKFAQRPQQGGGRAPVNRTAAAGLPEVLELKLSRARD